MLAGSRLGYLVVFVDDVAKSTAFYEGTLGLRVVERRERSVKLEAGGVLLWLRPADQHGVTLYARRDDSSDIVFLVEDLEQMRAALEARGVEFFRRRSYEVGLVTDFYDPNGHRLMLYQPSEVALTWPSADKIREVWRTYGRGNSQPIGPASGPAPGPSRSFGLLGKPLVYLFMFENDQTAAFDFYREDLGLTVLERVHCCNQECAEEIEGIAKYDGGGVLLSTHHVHPAGRVVDDLGREYSPAGFDPAHGQGIAPVFLVDDLSTTRARLRKRGVDCGRRVERWGDGPLARFEDPFGHPFYLYEPAGSGTH